MYRLFLFFLLILAAEAAGQDAVQAGSPGGTRVGFVDIELVIENSEAIQQGIDALDEQLAERAREIDRAEREFRRQRFEMDRQERLISEEQREQRRQELVALQEEISRLQFEFEREVAAKERVVEPVLSRIMNLVADVADREGIDIVLRGEVVIYGNAQADLTPLVIEEIDKRAEEMRGLFAEQGVAPARATQETETPAAPEPEPEAEPRLLPPVTPAPGDGTTGEPDFLDEELPLIP